MTTAPITRIVQMHKAIGHPVRLRLLGMLRGGPLCVCQMTVVVKLAASTVSEHLSELRKAGLVVEKKEGRWVEYRLSESPEVSGLLAAIWPTLEPDPQAKADVILLRELRKVAVEELCRVNLDLGRIERPALANAVARAETLRASS